MILVFRFSAMGDVAMAANVLREFAVQHNGPTVVMVTREAFRPFFSEISGLVFHPFDPDHTHRGVRGLYRLFKELCRYTPTAVADLHYSIRTRFLAWLFRMKGVAVQQLDKGKREKKELTRPHHKIMRPLKPMVERYADVFRKLGYPITLKHQLQPQSRPLPEAAKPFFSRGEGAVVGIAPFAQHQAKVYPADRMEVAITYLVQQGHTVLVFGGSEGERQQAEKWQQKYPQVHSIIGLFSLKEELDITAHLDLMVSMDSAGMHMASLMGVRVVSIWGGTHPYIGFLGYGQRIEDCVQVEHPNRPSSVYGNKPCICDGKDSMELIPPEMVIAKLQEIGL